jgi:hypothetical protein
MNPNDLTTAEQIIAAIKANVDEFWERRRSYEDFGALNGQLWNRARALGHTVEVDVTMAVGSPRRFTEIDYRPGKGHGKPFPRKPGVLKP